MVGNHQKGDRMNNDVCPCVSCKHYHLDFALNDVQIANLSFLPDQFVKMLCEKGLAYEVQREKKPCDLYAQKSEVSK